MRWVRTFAVLAGLFALIANAQCVATCATAPCQAEKTSCHGHPAPHKAEVKPCGMVFVAADSRGPAANTGHQPVVAIIPLTPTDFSGIALLDGSESPAHLPPGRAVTLLSPILRV